MQTEAVPAQPTSEAAGKVTFSATVKDPILLGVSLPVSVTVAHAVQVKEAWIEAFQAILAAAKAKAAAAKNTNGAPKTVDATIVAE